MLLSWVLNLLYGLLLVLVSPVICYRMIVLGKYRDGWAEKFLGRLPQTKPGGYRVWFHAVSVGEVLQLQTIVSELKSLHPDWEIWITTTTHTGHKVAREKFPLETVCYFPLDFSVTVKNALRRVQPNMVVLVELELWPNFIRAVHDAKIPLVLVNGRISENSFRGYRRVRFLMKNLLRRFDHLAVQSQSYAERLIALGAINERITVTGSIKFDGISSNRENSQTAELKKSFGIEDEERVFIAGSTQSPEEAYALETYLGLRETFPNLRLILVPRHQERFEEVARLIEEKGLPLLRRSKIKEGTGGIDPKTENRKLKPVLLLDTLGELSACWGLAEIAFVGGSLTNRGGQNMIEPAAYGAGVLFGPNTRNFRDVVALLLNREAAIVVHDNVNLTLRVCEWLGNPVMAREFGERAQQLVLSQQGATSRTVKILSEAAGTTRARTTRSAA